METKLEGIPPVTTPFTGDQPAELSDLAGGAKLAVVAE